MGTRKPIDFTEAINTAHDAVKSWLEVDVWDLPYYDEADENVGVSLLREAVKRGSKDWWLHFPPLSVQLAEGIGRWGESLKAFKKEICRAIDANDGEFFKQLGELIRARDEKKIEPLFPYGYEYIRSFPRLLQICWKDGLGWLMTDKWRSPSTRFH